MRFIFRNGYGEQENYESAIIKSGLPYFADARKCGCIEISLLVINTCIYLSIYLKTRLLNNFQFESNSIFFLNIR